MNFQTIKSINNTSIRLTYERLYHIIENHNELAGRAFEILEAVANPDMIFQGRQEEFLATKGLNHHWLIVVYREDENDGFVITAFETSKIDSIKKFKKIIWVKSN